MQLIGLNFETFLRSKYLILTLSLFTMMLAFPLMDEQMFGKMIFALFFLFILIGILYSIKGTGRILIYMFIGLFVLGVNVAEIGFKQLEILSRVFSILFYFYTIVLFCKDIYSRKQITTDVLLGSICVYLLIGIGFALFYMVLQSINISTIIHQASMLPLGKQSDFYYFSFITLATVGFGDILPQTGFAKSVVMIEGIVGIFYIAIMVARLVAVFNINK